MHKYFVSLIIFFSIYTTHAFSSSLEQFVDKELEKKHLNGVVLLAQDNKILYQKAFGFSNFDKQELNKLDTNFVIASITKTYTAAALLKLHHEGKINLNDKIITYLPELDFKFADEITIHQLLTHTSGIADIPTDFNLKIENLHELNKVIKDIKPNFTPGKKFYYSPISNYRILAEIIQKVSGKTYEQYIQEDLLINAGYKNFHIINSGNLYDLLTKNDSNYAIGYEKISKNKAKMDNFDPDISTIIGAANIVTNAYDLHNFLNSLFNYKIIDEPSIKLMTTSYVKTPKNSYGYGLYIDHKIIKNSVVYLHTGGGSGYKNIFMYEPTNKICIIILSNGGNIPIFDLTSKIIKKAYQTATNQS